MSIVSDIDKILSSEASIVANWKAIKDCIETGRLNPDKIIDTDSTRLIHVAAHCGLDEFADYLIRKGVDLYTPRNMPFNERFSPLKEAVFSGNCSTIALFASHTTKNSEIKDMHIACLIANLGLKDALVEFLKIKKLNIAKVTDMATGLNPFDQALLGFEEREPYATQQMFIDLFSYLKSQGLHPHLEIEAVSHANDQVRKCLGDDYSTIL